MASISRRDGTGEESGSYKDVDSESIQNPETIGKMCYEDGDKERKTDSEKGKHGKGGKDKRDRDKSQEKEVVQEIEKPVTTDKDETGNGTSEDKCDDSNINSQNVIPAEIDPISTDRILPEENRVAEAVEPINEVSSQEKTVPDAESQERKSLTDDSGRSIDVQKSSSRTKPFGPNHLISQGQIDSYTARVLAMEKSLGNNDNRVEQSAAAAVAATSTSTVADRDYPYQHLISDPARARSPSVPNTLTLGIPRDADGYQYGSMDDTSPSGSRRALSPLLEVRRPHCTLNCENCKTILEERFKHSRFFFYFIKNWSVLLHCPKFFVRNDPN